jgi:hypothetical protein
MSCALGRLDRWRPSTAAGSWWLGRRRLPRRARRALTSAFRTRLGFAFPSLAAAGIRSCPVPRLIATAGAPWTGAQVSAHGLAAGRSC